MAPTDQAAAPQDRASSRPGETTFLSIALILALVMVWQAYAISGFSGLATPGVFPMIAASFMAISAAVTLVTKLRSANGRRSSEPSVGRFLREVTPLRLILLLALIVVYVVGLPRLGFLVASGLFLFGSLVLLWRGAGALRLVLVTLGSLACIHLVFRQIFQVVLPQGDLWRWLG